MSPWLSGWFIREKCPLLLLPASGSRGSQHFPTAQSNFPRAVLVLHIPGSFWRQERCSAGSPRPPDLQTKEQNQLTRRSEGPKSSARGLETVSALLRAGDGARCLALPVGSANLSVLCRSGRCVSCTPSALCLRFAQASHRCPFSSVYLLLTQLLPFWSKCS